MTDIVSLSELAVTPIINCVELSLPDNPDMCFCIIFCSFPICGPMQDVYLAMNNNYKVSVVFDT